ncbi:UNVERIFIED_CONTAM: miniconductance mechanosensitive channel [Acetivibrio alkalicellulosi]
MIQKFFLEILNDFGVSSSVSGYLSYILLGVLIIMISVVANIITKNVILRIVSHYIKNNRFKWDNIMLERKVFQRLSHLVPAIIIRAFSTTFPSDVETWILKGVSIYIIIIGVLTVDAFLTAVNDIYNTFKVSKEKPIKSYIQVIKIFLYIVAGILVIGEIIGESPLILLGGIGALSAVLMLVFKDSILGLVAGVQLSSNDMVRVGDWIEMPKYGADGDVIDISLNTVKVQNFDRTITTIPTYLLVSDSFKNWRGMQEAGGRRIMRSVYIDTSSISFCTDEMIEKYKKVHYLKDYIIKKQKEIDEYNKKHNVDSSVLVNGRHLTNIGVFRVYIDNYLKNHPKTHKGMIQIVRQLPPKEFGLPLEIYVFTNETDWIKYEGIQADIFDHILAVAPKFDLIIFQNPTGYDFKAGFKNISVDM